MLPSVNLYAVLNAKLKGSYMTYTYEPRVQILRQFLRPQNAKTFVFRGPNPFICPQRRGSSYFGGWREESFEDLHPRDSGSGYDAVTDLLSIR